MSKTLEGKIAYQIIIHDDGNVDLRFEQSNENNLIAFEMARKMCQEMADSKYYKSKVLKERNLIINVCSYLQTHINTLAKFVSDKYKDAVPEEEKVKLLKYNPLIDKLSNLKK